MPTLIVVRLRPTRPVSGEAFTSALSGLTVEAFDLGFGSTAEGRSLGSAHGVFTSVSVAEIGVDLTRTAIVQHYIDTGATPTTPPTIRSPAAAATAVIVVDPPPTGPEYPTGTSFDLRLKLTRDGAPIADRRIDFNAVVTTVDALPILLTDVVGLPPSAYAVLPAAASGAGAHLELPEDGTPPDFASLVKAVNAVLALDPADGSTIAQRTTLSGAQAKHVAAEIEWDRKVHPAPPEPRPLAQMYTSPQPDVTVDADRADNDRRRFEAELDGYYATHDGNALRLSGYVYAVWAAMMCERLSTGENLTGPGPAQGPVDGARAALLTLPLPRGAGDGTTLRHVSVTLTGDPAHAVLDPPFVVPAAYFYALGAQLPPQVDVAQRFAMASADAESKVLVTIETAVEAGVVGAAEPPATGPGGTGGALVPAQAARRLRAIGQAAAPAPEVAVDAAVRPLIVSWLAHTGPTATIDADLWVPATASGPGAAAYLSLLLHAVTGGFAPLIAAITTDLGVTTAAGLRAVTEDRWRALFLPPGAPPRLDLLPPFTEAGTASTPQDRVDAFLRHLRQFLTVPFSTAAGEAPAEESPSALPRPRPNVFAAFEVAYSAHGGGTYTPGTPRDPDATRSAALDVFPGDPHARAWLLAALDAIDALHVLTAFAAPGEPSAELRFSLMEALYARGFTTVAAVAGLTPDAFEHALEGTVAHRFAPEIQEAAGGSGSEPGGEDLFSPVNRGTLTDCLPPEHLSPFGLVAYLSELLRLSAASTCANPFPSEESANLGDLLADRRGTLGGLVASAANLATPVPSGDLVNESLEHLAAAVASGGTPSGVVFDTASEEVGGHRIGGPDGHDAGTLLAAVPEHSAPSAPLPAAYAALRAEPGAPPLPYDQGVDTVRSYLRAAGTSRYEVMRRFRKRITEFALDPAHEPDGFAAHRQRYPVRLETALEYLCLTVHEYAMFFAGTPGEEPSGDIPAGWRLYGFPRATVGRTHWSRIAARLPDLLARTGLEYCELAELQRSGIVPFDVVKIARRRREEGDGRLPVCPPCDPEEYRARFPGEGDTDRAAALVRLMLVVRLWRALRSRCGGGLSFQTLADVDDVLRLFTADGAVNPDFPRQLAALLMLCDDLRLPLGGGDESGPLGRVPLLALWAADATPRERERAVALLLEGVEETAERADPALETSPELLKIIAANLDPLSVLAGFDPDTPSDTWHSRPAATLRFAEVLLKVYLSPFTVGELLFLFTTGDHLDGDDPFPLQDRNEAADDPLMLGDTEPFDGQGPHSLWTLRDALGDVAVTDEEAASWPWTRIAASLRADFGYTAPTGVPDPLDLLGRRFFAAELRRRGIPVSAAETRFAVPLAAADTSPDMWAGGPPEGGFGYDRAAEELYCLLPLRDADVLERLLRMRPLNPVERRAVRDLYFAPRAAWAPFAALFENPVQAIESLVQEGDDDSRFALFQKAYALFTRRAHVVAGHLARHVAAATDGDSDGADEAAWLILRGLWADENFGLAPWEDDSGAPPDVTYPWRPGAGAFAALLGLRGTGLVGEFRPDEPRAALRWREVRGPLDPFGDVRNATNAPVPTVLPAMDLELTDEQERYVSVRNGLALLDATGEPLGGAEPFTARWEGALLVEHDGTYRFHAGHAPDNDEHGHHEHGDWCEGRRWRVVLRRGQRVWTVLNHGLPGDEAPGHRSGPLRLRRGAYEITIEAEQDEPRFASRADTGAARTGFRFAYAGPDTGDAVTTLPFDRLFRPAKDATLGDGVVRNPTLDAAGRTSSPIRPGENAAAWLNGLYTSSLRDIRRTYQRAFKALLVARRFGLSARPVVGYRQSELGYLLAHGATFTGTSHPRTGAAAFGTHRAWLSTDLVPVGDPYLTDAVVDQRSRPGRPRQAALFDVWERLYDYCDLRRDTRTARERPVWILFAEVTEQQPDDPVNMLRHLGVDARHAPLVSVYLDVPPDPYRLGPHDLEDERWAIRAWLASRLLDRITERLVPRDIGAAHPYLWAADDPAAPVGTPPRPGAADLVRFVEDAFIENGRPRRYTDLQRLNDGLRERARHALLAYLSGPGRFAAAPGDLSDLLLQDVGAGPGQRVTRIEDGAAAVQAFVQRALLGLEPSLTIPYGLRKLWRNRFATFAQWRACARREAYPENWIEWDDLREARRSEAFRMLDARLREDELTVPVPGGLAWWRAARPPEHPSLTLVQDATLAVERLLTPAPEGLGLLGGPVPSAQPSWLAPVALPAATVAAAPGEAPAHDVSTEVVPAAQGRDLPLWLTAAMTLGVAFVRVAAAGIPPASAHLMPYGHAAGCCRDCADDRPEEGIDEYYFWLVAATGYDEADPARDADAGVVVSTPEHPVDQTSDWHRRDKLPGLLLWPPARVAHLHWCRVRDGRFEPPRRSAEAVRLRPGRGVARLVFEGRTDDTLRFSVPDATPPVGHTDPTAPGFRYDLPLDDAVVLPLVTAPDTPAIPLPGGMAAYPYFTMRPPGAPLLPLSPFPVATAVAGALRAHGRHEAALAWYGLAYRPLDADNTWRPGDSDGDAVRRRDVLLSFAETLAQAADAAFARGDLESARQARVLFDALARLLGPSPRRVSGEPGAAHVGLADFVPRPAPLNPRLLALYERVGDRLALVRHDIDAHRLRRGPDVTADPADPCADGCDGTACHGPIGPYRFTYLMQKALDLASEVRGLGASLLNAYEKGDAEALASLRTAHERQLAELGLRTRQLQWREADWQVQALEKTKQGALTRLAYNQALLRAGNNAGELGYEAMTVVSTASRIAGNVSEAVAQGLGMTPDFWLGVAGIAGTPLQFNQFPLGNKLAAGFSTAARILAQVAENANTTGGLSLTEGGWQRREDEWRHQVQVIGVELQQIERQILAAERHRDAALRDLEVQERQIENTREVQDYLRDRFSSAELYLHLQRETAALHRRHYDLALRLARRARRAFVHERGTPAPELPSPGWDTLREGLLAGDRLHLALREIETAYVEENCREYELARHLSLRAEFPVAFLQLQQTGYCEIEIPEWLLDLDHPGHYMRRIRNVTLTIPCVVGPYTSVNCRLTLLSSRTRVDPSLREAPAPCCDAARPPGAPVACRCPGGGTPRACPCASGECCASGAAPVSGYDAGPDDPRIVHAYDATEAIATSSGQNDSGMFELNFRDERYLPFEFRGAVSRWRVELPPEDNRFPLASVSDVVMLLNYTSREGGDVLRAAARAAAAHRLPGAGVRLVDVRRDLPDDWHRLQRPGHRLPLRLTRELFPYVPGGCDLRVTRVELFAELDEPGCRSLLPAVFHAHHGHRPDEPCSCSGVPVDCVASAEWPCLFHGVVDTDLAVRPHPSAELVFPDLPVGITALHLLCTYTTEQHAGRH
ncbi:neuraminidase-like domain-containing protein [Actinomadura decatromicini]|uniref:Insecticidal toxin complex protein n=1 Tax=Actinomadura decatromicini TaxID=2604572 RepID=A0A5D3FWP1_9ACTN|nr:neuraminidase-like domain-containing protein [Actinomadura decatromicini]TYK52653.1 insecticidal toxin complex protein [Actinomadura decatromicini]